MIELGERSEETVVREFNEELGVEITIRRYISCLENIFRIDGNIGHEISQIYLVDFREQNLYQKTYFTVSEGNKFSYAKWVQKEEIISGNKILYPNGLTEILQKEL